MTIAGPPWLDSRVPGVESSSIDEIALPVWDVVIVGGGIVGLCSALSLHESGRSVCVLDAGTVGTGTTGSATAKVTSAHGVVTSHIAARHGLDIAIRYQQANDRGFAWLADRVSLLPEDVGWSTTTHVVHGRDASDDLNASVEIAAVSASHPSEADAPLWGRGRAVTWGSAALVQPMSLARSLAGHLRRQGVALREHALVRGVEESAHLMKLSLDGGAIVRARHVIIATGAPVVDPELLAPRMTSRWHLAVALTSDVPVPTTLDVDGAGLSTRSATLNDGRQVAILVGPACDLEDLSSGHSAAVLNSLAAQWFDLSTATHRWAARDGTSPGGVPVAARSRRRPHVTVLTGMNGWGFTNAAAIARELPRLLDIVAAPDARFSGPIDDLWECGQGTSVRSLIEVGTHTAGSLARGLVRSVGRVDPAQIPEGTGVVMGGPLSPRAVCRTRDGVVHAVSARCTHAGCLVAWNAVGQAWACPCHGSQFAPDGTVLEGPASRPLPAADL